ncbi:6-methylsalicylic acid synthase acuA [Cladobotryum mycophilum]|uniref:6-methylsalicylic acid synthase n=1 Tax=Cladobotryum mycophilum TaxID=491253 RepID=A0ABR0SI78_9HYPO
MAPSQSFSSSSLSSTGRRSPMLEADMSTMYTPVTESIQSQFTKDVAVVGMACRVAGGNNSLEELWQFLLEKKDACGKIPEMRWEPYHRRDSRNANILNQTTARGYFLDHLENFDAPFFGISPKEAEQMDPQQRLSLEVTWEALENAGITAKNLPNIEAWMGIGTAYCGVPNRISYHLNLMGPSTAVDAACASSLVAIHHGVQAIILGESKIAIVGGVNAVCGPGLSRVLDQAGAVSPEGRCCSFDNDARGYGRGEGAGAVILKDISQAIRDGDPILAVIKGTAVGQDGKTNGIMAPNPKAQELVARNALKVAGIDPLSVGYVEAHATSTPLGDPTEVSAMANVYGTGRKRDQPCFIGSIKPNIGHLEAGAGVMGFIKAVLAVQNGVLPPQANLQTLNKRIDWDSSGLKVVQEITQWPETDNARRAAICSYGYGGTVSHAVIEQFVSPEALRLPIAMQSQSLIPSPSVLLLSGPQVKRPSVQARALKGWMETVEQYDLPALATTLAVRRDHHDYRAAIVVDEHEDAIQALYQLENGANHPWTTQNRVLGSDINKDVVWVFSGHGAQWANMGKGLLHIPVFCEAIKPLDDIVMSEIGISPMALLRSGEFGSSAHVQILTYIMQIGLSAVLHGYGMYPQAVIGHSVGEIAASVVAGAITAEEGAIIVTRRSVLYRQVMGKGAMILVNKPYKEITKELQGREGLVAAIDSSPSSCVIAGSVEAISKAVVGFKQRSIKVFRVQTDIAFHSPMLEKLVGPLTEALDGILSPVPPNRARLYSTSLQDPRGEDLRDSRYWANNMVNPVHLTSAVQAAADDSYRNFLEVSSHPLVSHSITETLMEVGIEDYTVVPTLMRDKPGEKSILHAIAQLHCRGVPVEWEAIMTDDWEKGLPNMPWIHKPAWRKIETGPINIAQTHDVEKHTLLGQRIGVASTDTILYTTRLDNDSKPFPGSHPLHGTEIVPAAALINTFVKATGANVLENVVLRVPVAINAPRSVQVVAQRNEVKILSQLIQQDRSTSEESSWVTHTTARWDTRKLVPVQPIDLDTTKARIKTQLRDDFTIDYLDKVGVSAMGYPWKVTEHYGNTQEMLARVDVAPNVSVNDALPWDIASWAPILDAATSVGSTLFFDKPRLRMPAQIEQVSIFSGENPPKISWLYVEEATDTALASHVSVLNEAGQWKHGELGSSNCVAPATMAEDPLLITTIILVSDDESLSNDYAKTIPSSIKTIQVSSVSGVATNRNVLPFAKETAIVYIPGEIQSLEAIPKAAKEFTWQLLELLKFVLKNYLPVKIFALTSNTVEGETATSLAQAALIGLSRVLASEHSDHFGGLIDTEVTTFPLTAIRYVQGADVILIRDGVARTARLRSLPRYKLLSRTQEPQLLPRPDGTYLITGGFGALGLEVADFLVEKGARRLVLVSRRSLPPRRMWDEINDDLAPVVNKIRELECHGASIYVVALDIGLHAAGVLDNQLALDTTQDAFARVLDPKITGGLVLHEVFPPRSVDFFVLFSSCGQLIGFTGQSSYGSANTFLDTLATHRRAQGDCAVSFQWTSWRGLGMGASTDFINAELESKGITDVTRDEAFAAWMHLAKYDIDHGVVLRSLSFDEGEPLPTPLLSDIAIRRAGHASSSKDDDSRLADNQTMPQSEAELKVYLDQKIRGCVAQVLHMGADEVDSKAALSDLGVDSVMTVSLRRQLQQALKVKVPPTLTWSHPTVSHLGRWFMEKIRP